MKKTTKAAEKKKKKKEEQPHRVILYVGTALLIAVPAYMKFSITPARRVYLTPFFILPLPPSSKNWQRSVTIVFSRGRQTRGEGWRLAGAEWGRGAGVGASPSAQG